MSEEQYLPIKESLGYKNVRQALWNVFSVDLNHIIIDEKLFESFSFRFQYREYEMTMIISDTEKHVQFQAGEGGLFDVWIPNPNNSFWGSSNLYELVSDQTTKEKIRYIFGKNEKDVEYALQVLKDFLDSDEAKVLLKNG
ncbi:hypothetical protein [Streptococcus equi]|uniref:hypothetical protein n=1 Tax=Streptococcus equi TaxID=1336 RepID=UPI001E2862C3|nr:hypothetical protein [Streptococcus equi]MCD3367547.1 hypothetical protein [Streptococcus equi subsp. zooepidemicus]